MLITYVIRDDHMLYQRQRKRSDSVLCQSPYTDIKIQKATWKQNKNAIKNFTTIADKLKTVSLAKDNHTTGVVKIIIITVYARVLIYWPPPPKKKKIDPPTQKYFIILQCRF